MEFEFKKSSEFSEEEVKQLLSLFKDAFDRETNYERLFTKYYELTPLGYSFHGIIKDNGKIIAHNAYLPLKFKYYDKDVLFANTVTSMVASDCRDFLLYYRLITSSYKELKKEGVSFVYGYPNENAYPVVSKSKLLEDIGACSLYCLPVRIGKIKKSLGFLNFISPFLCKFYASVCHVFASRVTIQYPIHQDYDSFVETRYKRDSYSNCNAPGVNVFYKVLEYEGINTAFILDVIPKSSKNFSNAVRHILKTEKVDMIMYQGLLPFKSTGLVRVPHSLEPKHFNFTGHIIDSDVIKRDIFDLSNWDQNLSIQDLV